MKRATVRTVRSQSADSRRQAVPMKPFIFPLVCYSMAAMALCIELLPDPAFAIIGGRAEGETRPITLVAVAVFCSLGFSVHALLYWANPEKAEIALMIKVGAAMAAVMAGLFVVSATVSTLTGASPDQLQWQMNRVLFWLGPGIGAAMLLLLAGTGTAFFISLRLHPVNRMNRKLQAKDYAAAIAIGERALGESQSFGVRFNLAHAYLGNGQVERAQAMYDQLAAVEGTPELFTEEAHCRAIETLAEKLRQSVK